MSTLSLRVTQFESPTLFDDLSKTLQAQIGGTLEGMPPELAQERAKDLEAIAGMVAQAVQLAAIHKIKGSGTVEIELGNKAQVTVHTEEASSAQRADPRIVAQLAEARAAKAKAAARKIVAPAPPAKPSGPTFNRPEAPKPAPATSQVQRPPVPATSAVSGGSKGSPKGGRDGGKAPASRPTTPPPRRS